MTSEKYSIGRIRALEAGMLTKNKFLRMVDAEDLQAAFHILNETEYADLLNKVSSPFQFEQMLNLARLELKKLSDLLAPKNKTMYSFWQKYDYENIKSLIKAKRFQEENPPLYQSGNIDPKIIKEYIFKKEGFLEKEHKELIDKAETIQDNLEMFDFIDQAYSPPKTLPKTAKYESKGIEPILNFFISKEEEIRKIGFILECKKNNIDVKQIKERLKTATLVAGSIQK